MTILLSVICSIAFSLLKTKLIKSIFYTVTILLSPVHNFNTIKNDYYLHHDNLCSLKAEKSFNTNSMCQHFVSCIQ